MKLLPKTVNLQRELLAVRKKTGTENALLAQVYKILNDNRSQTKIASKIPKQNRVNEFHFDLLETQRIFHIDQIKVVCITFRLRFLDIKYFKNALPAEAVVQIDALEQTHSTELSNFKIAAPTKAFRLKNYDDPLLFVPMGNDYFYLVHQWGNEMSSLRKWLVMPFRNLGNFIVFCLMLSLIITALTPETNLSRSVPMASTIIFLFAFKSVFAVLLYGFFMRGKKFSSSMWNSVYYNN